MDRHDFLAAQARHPPIVTGSRGPDSIGRASPTRDGVRETSRPLSAQIPRPLTHAEVVRLRVLGSDSGPRPFQHCCRSWRSPLWRCGSGGGARCRSPFPCRQVSTQAGPSRTMPNPRGVPRPNHPCPRNAAPSVRPEPRADHPRVSRTMRDRLAHQLALAHWIERAVEDGRVASYGEVARALGLTKSKIKSSGRLIMSGHPPAEGGERWLGFRTSSTHGENEPPWQLRVVFNSHYYFASARRPECADPALCSSK